MENITIETGKYIYMHEGYLAVIWSEFSVNSYYFFLFFLLF